MKKITLLIIFNLSVLTLFGQIFAEDWYHPFDVEEAQYASNPITQFQQQQSERQKLDSITYQSSTSGEWENYLKYEYAYDNNELATLRLIQNWNEYTQQWQNDTRNEYTNDDFGNRILSFYKGWNSSTQQWIDERKYEYTYNEIGNRTLCLYSRLEYGIWTSIFEDEYGYDSNGNLVLILRKNWEDNTQEWVISTKYDHTYNNEGQLITRIRSSWSGNPEQWTPTIRYEYTYDNTGNLITYFVSNFSTSTEQWIANYKYDYQYDNSYTYDELIMPFSAQFFQHKRTSAISKLWNESTQEWMNSLQGVYHYSDQAVGITPATEAGIDIFPNPANDVITFNLENTKPTTIQLYDAQGKYLQTQALAQNNQVSVRHLDSGLYFYQLQHDGEVFGGKFMVK